MAITDGYCTLADVKAALRVYDSVDDSLLETAITSASRLIDQYCGRKFTDQGTSARYFAATDPYLCPIDDAQSVTQLATAVTSNGSFDTIWANYVNGAPGDYQLEPLNGYADGIEQPYTSIRALWRYLFPTIGGNALVKVTAHWGWAAVPDAIAQAAVIQASRIYKRLESPLGVLGLGDLGVVRVGSKLDPDVAMLIDGYRLTRNFA